MLFLINMLGRWQRELWIMLPRGGALVGNGPFIPCKPPLRSAASEVLDEGDRCTRTHPQLNPYPSITCRLSLTRSGRRFDAGMFMDKQVNARRNVGLVVALTNALTREVAALRARFGSPVLFAVLQMG